jgi:hypothetical protein
MTSEFKELQNSACTPEPESPPDISDFCPTCVPDSNYLEPNWWTTEQPYLNKKTCEYITIATMTEDGDVHNHASLGESGKTFDQILNSYKKTGLNFLLNYYNKERGVELNGRPLIDYVKASDYHFYSFASSTMVVMISIPANVFDVVPEKPAVSISSDLAEQVLTIKPIDLWKGLKTLRFALGTYSKFQAIHYQFSNSKLVFEKTGEPIYLKFYDKRIKAFESELERLLEKNGFSMTSFFDINRSPYEIEFTFKASEREGTYKIEKIRAKKRLQGWKRIKKGINSFKKRFNKDATLMAFVSRMKYIDLRLNARKSPNWEDFCNEFVFPKVTMKSPKSSMFNTGFPNLNDHLSGLDDFIFDGIISFTDAFVYNLNQSNKTNLEKLNKLPQKLNEYDFRLGEISFKFAKDRKKKKTKTSFCLVDFIKNLQADGEQYIKEIWTKLDPCKLKDMASTIMLCIIGNVEIETAFLAIIKSTFRNITAEGLEILLQNLPPNIQDMIQKEVADFLSGQPDPWTKEYQERIEQQEKATIGSYLPDRVDTSAMEEGPSLSSEDSKAKKEQLTALSVLQEIGVALEETEIFKIYEQAIMKYAEIKDIMTAVSNLPGVELLTKFLGISEFPTTHFITPPIDSFFKSLTFDPCADEFNWPGLPKLNELPDFKGWDWLKAMAKAFIIALKLTVKQVIQALIAKIASKLSVELPTIGDLACQGLQLNNENPVANLLTGRGDLGDVLASAIEMDTPSHKMGADGDTVAKALAEATGIITDDVIGTHLEGEFGNLVGNASSTSGFSDYSFDRSKTKTGEPKTVVDKSSMPFLELTKAISVSSTKNEIIRAITLPEEEQDLNYLRNMANTLPHMVPEFSNSINSVDKVMKFFMSMGNKLTPDQREFLQESISPDDRREPLEETICLTNEEYANWIEEREKAFKDSGLNPEAAKDFVNKQNERIKSDLDDMLDLFANGTDGLLKNAIDKALSSDKCKNPNALITTDGTPANSLMSDAANSVFRRLQDAFVDDTIEWNFFERLVDSPGILSLILADKKGFTLNYHNAVSDSAILRFFLPDPGELPKTVCIQLFDHLNDATFTPVGGSVVMTYNNELDGDDLFESSVAFIQDPKNYNYKVHVKTSVSNYSFEMNNHRDKNRDSLVTNLGSIWDDFDYNLPSKNVDKFIININEIMFNKLTKKCFMREGDEPSWGFVYDKTIPEITKEDIKYVGPGGEDYEYEEEQGILGRSQTSNPRVVFLEPSEHGGTYRKPKYYIKPAKHQGWRKIAKMFVPNSDKKGDPLTFLHVPNIVETMNKTMGSLDADPRLAINPDEIAEIPFDKIGDPTHLATFDGFITAHIRVYLADFFIRAMPVLSNVEINSKNYDDSVLEFIVEIMQEGMISQTSTRSSIYSGYVYWLLFLEQVAQSFDRRYDAYSQIIKDNKDNLTQELKDLDKELRKYDLNVLKIRAAQDNFVSDSGVILPFLHKEETWSLTAPRNSETLRRKRESLEEDIEKYKRASRTSEVGEMDYYMGDPDVPKEEREDDEKGLIQKLEEELEVVKENEVVYEMKKVYGDNVVRGSLMIAYGKDYWRWLGLDNGMREFINRTIPSPYSKVDKQYGFSIDGRIPVNFKKLKEVKDANFASKIFSIQSVEKDCKEVLKFLIREQLDYYSPILADKAKPHITDINRYFFGASKIFDITPSIGIEKETFENIRGCVHDPSKQNPLDGLPMTTEELDDIKKNGSFFFEKYLRVTEKPGSPLNNRGDLLTGVVNPSKFMNFLKSKQGTFDADKPISEYFGNAKIIDDKIIGSVGIKFGVRLCYVPPDDFISMKNNTKNLKQARLNKSFIFKEALIDAKPKAVAGAFEIAKENSDEAMMLLSAAVPGLGVALAIAGIGGDEFEKVMEFVEGFIPPTEFAGSKNIFPICRFEEDLPDDPISLYLNLPNDDFNQDISCYIDKIFESRNYKMIFGKTINVKKIPSLLSIYSYTSFLNALGLDGDERDDSDESEINANNMGRVFNDCRKELKKMFISLYKKDRTDKEDEEESIRDDQVVRNKNKRLSSTLDHVVMSKEIPWFSKWNKVIDNPLIGWAFGNKYAKMFDLVKTDDEEE